MSKYKHLMDKVLTFLDHDYIEDTFADVFDSLERAPWWVEIDKNYRYVDGEPFRCEYKRTAQEGLVNTYSKEDWGIKNYSDVYNIVRFFYDVRWNPND